MLYLLLAVLLNVYISVFFKVIPRWGIDSFQCIVVNYWVCTTIGFLSIGESDAIIQVFKTNWYGWAIVLGACFISLFYLISFVTRNNGIATASVANKISLILSVAISLVLYRESLHWLKILGLLLAIPAVYLSFLQKNSSSKQASLLFPILLFFGSGSLDAMVQFVQQEFVRSSKDVSLLTMGIFFVAAFIGTCILLYLLLRRKASFHWKNVLAGVALGIPNYGSIYFFIKLLNSNFFESSTAIAITNIAVVLLAVLIAALFFKEKFTLKRGLGIFLAVAAIILITLSARYA